MENNQPPQQDPQEPTTTTNPADVEGGSEREKPVEDEEEKEKEEEEAFLVSLYKFMKERHTPIERIPHLGFKQINLWKIYKAVEKLGAYELVTGRRLWKNVYDELGGSPGSTSAATCTRRHYERLVLPYVRHLKGEEDKPLPPSKPRRQHKGARDDRGKRARKDKGREQVPLEKARPEVAGGPEEPRASPERGRGSLPAPPCRPPSPSRGCPSPSRGCPSPCRPHKRLFSSFYSKGNPPIMSPLAKKKLLAQVSEAESLCCHQGRCHPGGTRWAPGEPGPAPRSPEPSGAQEAAPSAGNEAGCSGMEPAPVPTVFTGYFHAYGSEGLQAPLWGCFSNLKDFLEPPPAFPEPEQPWESRGAAVHAWVPPGPGGAARAGHGREEEEEEEEEEDEEPFGPSAKLRAVSPFPRDAEGHRDTGGHQGLPKPKAVVASPGFAALHFPAGFGNPLEHLKTQGVPVAPGLSANPFVIPAFPSPLVVGSSELCRPLPGGHFPPSYGNSLRHRLYPWHGHHSCGSPAFHRHAKL